MAGRKIFYHPPPLDDISVGDEVYVATQKMSFTGRVVYIPQAPSDCWRFRHIPGDQLIVVPNPDTITLHHRGPA